MKKGPVFPPHFKLHIKTQIFEMIIYNSSTQALLYFCLLQLKLEVEYRQETINHYSED